MCDTAAVFCSLGRCGLDRLSKLGTMGLRSSKVLQWIQSKDIKIVMLCRVVITHDILLNDCMYNIHVYQIQLYMYVYICIIRILYIASWQKTKQIVIMMTESTSTLCPPYLPVLCFYAYQSRHVGIINDRNAAFGRSAMNWPQAG